MLIKKINSVEFRVLGPQTIRKMGAVEIRTPDTYDKDGYPMEGGLMDPHLGVINPGLRCKTCGQKMKQCPGHFGTLELIRPVVHPEFSNRIDDLLQATCTECGRILLPEEKLKELTHLLILKGDLTKEIVRKTRNIKKCPHCKANKQTILLDKPTNFYIGKERLYPTQIRDWVERIPNDDVKFFGYDPEQLRPEWFVLTVLQIPPITIRPSITLDNGIKSEDDLTHKLVDIIRINMRLKDNIEAGAPQLIIEDLWDLLQYHVTTYFDNDTAGVAPAKHRSGRALRTIVQRLKGKRGRFRYNLIGKRVNSAARSTISPDAFVGINELGVPADIANELTVPEAVTEWNKKEFVEEIKKDKSDIAYIIRPTGVRKKITETNKKEVLDELDIGFSIERTLRNGDIVLFNRQPSLHRISMMAHRVKIMPGKTFRLNPTVTKPYNADFDGDEMNLHVPQTEEGKTEAKELMLVQDQIISPRYGAPVITPQEDGVSGVFILTMKTTTFSKEEAMKLLFEAGIEDMPKPDLENNRYSGKLIFSQLLPKDLNLEYKTTTCKALKNVGLCENCVKEECKYDAYVKIENGLLKTGVIDKASVGEGDGRLVDKLARDYPKEIITRFYDGTGKLAVLMVTYSGMTIGLSEYESTERLNKLKNESIEKEIDEAKKLVEQFKKGTLELIPGKTYEESFEQKMVILGSKVKRDLEKELMKEKIKSLDLTGETKEKPEFNQTVMVLSGSKGKSDNLTNLMGFWGQASVREGRPKRGFTKRLIALNEREDVGAFAGGFIQHSLMDGMKPKEYFYHAMGGRQGEVDTGVSTKVSGYLYRRLANALKDLITKNDRTVRGANNNIVQFTYGEDGVFPMKTAKGKLFDIDEEIEEMKREGKK